MVKPAMSLGYVEITLTHRRRCRVHGGWEDEEDSEEARPGDRDDVDWGRPLPERERAGLERLPPCRESEDDWRSVGHIERDNRGPGGR